MEISDQLQQLIDKVELQIDYRFKEINKIVEYNQWRVIECFQKHRVSDFHFSGSTGYGYNDQGREVLDLVYADVFGAEAALVRSHFVSGTHTISTALFGVLRPGDHLLFITGKPYDTLRKVIGEAGDGKGSLRDWGIVVEEVGLLENGSVNWEEVHRKIRPTTKMIGVQRSRGYEWRPSFTIAQMKEMSEEIHRVNPKLVVFVDNCYGEFTEKLEPTAVGVDLIAGSLIKNPGGGIAPIGGYIAGNKDLINLAANRLTSPGIGGEVGATLGTLRSFYQGLFLAPHMVGQAMLGSVFAAAIFEQLGLDTEPKWHEMRTDLIQAIKFTSKEHLITFVQSIQKSSAVDSHVTPVPWDMPGYEHPVIMAAGTFIQGGSLELTADAPIREPYIAYLQGGLTYEHVKYSVIHAINQMHKDTSL